MEIHLQSEIANKWLKGIQIATQRMVLYKYRNHQSIVISTKDGIKLISGDELKQFLIHQPGNETSASE